MRLQTAASTGVLSLLALLSNQVSAHPQVGLEHAATHHAHLAARDIRTHVAPKNDDGERHGELKAPKGSKLTSLTVADGVEIAAFWSEDPKNDEAKHAYIMIHGRQRDGDAYWTTMNNILQSAIDAANAAGITTIG